MKFTAAHSPLLFGSLIALVSACGGSSSPYEFDESGGGAGESSGGSGGSGVDSGGSKGDGGSGAVTNEGGADNEAGAGNEAGGGNELGCEPGSKRCDALVPEVCDEKGEWKAGEACDFVCSEGECAGECVPDTKDCDDLVPRTCGDDGEWTLGTACPFVCSDGECTGTCVPAAKDCSDLVPRSCGDDGQWDDGAPCAYVCNDGDCAGECVPGSKSCDGLAPRTCDETGTWQSATACDFVCTAGECTGSCVPGDEMCDVVPKTCDVTGTWQSEAACEFVCSGEGECTGECVPDSKSCDGLVPRTCDAQGAWQSGAVCDYVCGEGECSGECVPGSTRCSSETAVERCSEEGFWEESPCTQICSDKIDECACSPGYEGDGSTCTAIDFCAPEHGGCSPNAACSQTGIVPSCTCNEGFSGDGFACSTPTGRISEGFNDIGNLPGWLQENHSAAVGSTSWFQGNTVVFNAYNGATQAYIGANYNNTGNTGTISNWLVTPEIALGANTTVSFFTRKSVPDTYADRIEVRFCPATPCTMPTDANGVGSYTVLLGSVNPNLALGVYPTSWTQLTYTNSNGIGYSGTGRVAIRYYVPSAGFSGTNSDYIGIDQFEAHVGAPAYTVGGDVTGLTESGLVLWLNGSVTAAIAADGTFTFPNKWLDPSTPYSVSVMNQPAGQTCTVTNGTGSMGSANVTNVSVTCANDPN